MALIDHQTRFDADALSAPVIGIAARVGKHDSGMHQHQKGQLLYAPQGCMTIELQGCRSVLPPTQAAWIPPNTEHRASMNNVVEYRSLYFDTNLFISAPGTIQYLTVNELLKALIDRMSFWSWDISIEQTRNTTALFWEEFQLALAEVHLLPIPSDPRVTSILNHFLTGDQSLPSLEEFSRHVGASSKTVSRIFAKETGMNFQSWRQQWRLQRATELLALGQSVLDVSYTLEFSSDSAFIAFFKQHMGITPKQLF
ncbi:AraC family transcriptional regulator [Vibrio mediterranei]|uniref:AraC family transcriptional regulator n=1 Tax=Vibrio mediterranei TaxID=689 RepID=A0ABX5DIZ3_9VIBR|nr:helix-turn-helix transcriptional regulator [Vibrio mediterranei]PCD89021.1 AraC family transcriptional regulator [Vibrio mediterranei]PRQ68596.1 AraC family transcriptional regulator [Vibrio mediterranei]